LHYIDQVIGLPHQACSTYACMNGLMLPDRQVFLVDTHINYDPSAEQLAEITIMAAEEMKPLWRGAQSSFAVALQLWQQQPCHRRQNARNLGLGASPSALAGN
jgi:hypothetical protein